MITNATADLIAKLVEQARITDQLATRDKILERVDKLIALYIEERCHQ